MFDPRNELAPTGSIRPVDRDAAARRITESIGRLFFSAENQVRFHGAADELGLSPPMLKALLDLVPGEGRADARPGRTLGLRRLVRHGDLRRARGTRAASSGACPTTTAGSSMVELTPAGVEAQAWAAGEVYGPRAGFAALTPAEQRTLATLLGKMADAQDVHDRAISDDPKVRGMVRQMSAQRTREFRAQPQRRGGEPWTAQLEAHRRELADLKDELARIRDDLKAQLRQPVDQAKAAKADVEGTCVARPRRPGQGGQGRGARPGSRAAAADRRLRRPSRLKGGGRRR